jgi:hypothetical protein
MITREMFPFDAHPVMDCQGIRNIVMIAHTRDRRTFYVVAGKNGGVRFLAHFDEDYEMSLGRHLHQEVLLRLHEDSRSRCMDALRRAADQAARDGTIRELLPMWEVPGFEREQIPPRHESGWFSRSRYALPIPAPAWAPEAQVFDIREGIYMHFPDGSMRLAQRREYYNFDYIMNIGPYLSRVVGRQGDCLLIDGVAPEGSSLIPHDRFVKVGDHEAHLDRHQLRWDGNSLVLTHPEHETVKVPAEPGENYYAALIPGVSRPFRRAAYAD